MFCWWKFSDFLRNQWAQSLSGKADDKLNERKKLSIDQRAVVHRDVMVEVNKDSDAHETPKEANPNSMATATVSSPVRHRCHDCDYATDRKSNLTNHLNETCKVRRAKGLLKSKEVQCKYCEKKMTHNALRSHLRHFIKMITQNRKPKGIHGQISKDELTKYLIEIKFKN